MVVGIIIAVVFVLVFLTAVRTIRIVPQARARNVERFGRYRKTLEPGMNFVIPFVDRLKPLIDLREQVVSFKGAPVITEDNLVVLIDTVLFFQVTDPRAADYEIVNYIQAIEQITATMLRSVIGSMDLEQTLTSRDKINTQLRGVLDDASGKWGIRVTRVEIKAIDPPKSVKDAMEKQMRAEREKRAAILTAEGVRQAKILTADGEKQGEILRAEGDKQSAILRAEGQAQAISQVFQAIHRNDPDPKLLAYQYLQTLPQLAQGAGNTFWVIPSEVTTALRAVTSAFGGKPDEEPAAGASQAAGAAAGTALPVGPNAISPGASPATVGPAAETGAVGSGAGAIAAGNGVSVADSEGAVASGSSAEAGAVGSSAEAGAVGSEAAPVTVPGGENAAAALAAAGIAVPGQLSARNGAAAPAASGEASPGSGEEDDQRNDQQ